VVESAAMHRVGHEHVGVQGATAFFEGFTQSVTVSQVVHLPRNSYVMAKPFKWTYAGKPLTS
jgi:hypothetical protein